MAWHGLRWAKIQGSLAITVIYFAVYLVPSHSLNRVYDTSQFSNIVSKSLVKCVSCSLLWLFSWYTHNHWIGQVIPSQGSETGQLTPSQGSETICSNGVSESLDRCVPCSLLCLFYFLTFTDTNPRLKYHKWEPGWVCPLLVGDRDCSVRSKHQPSSVTLLAPCASSSYLLSLLSVAVGELRESRESTKPSRSLSHRHRHF